MSVDDSTCVVETLRFRLTGRLSLQQEHELRKQVDQSLFSELKTVCVGKILKVALSDKGAAVEDPLKGIRAFLSAHGLSFAYKYPARRAA